MLSDGQSEAPCTAVECRQTSSQPGTEVCEEMQLFPLKMENIRLLQRYSGPSMYKPGCSIDFSSLSLSPCLWAIPIWQSRSWRSWPPTSLRIQWQRLMTAVTCRGRIFRTGAESRSWKAKAILKKNQKKSKDERFRHHFTPEQRQRRRFHFKIFSCCPPNFRYSIFQVSHICSKKKGVVFIFGQLIVN